LDLHVGENHLSFIETSALDASNVELAFQNILTGGLHLEHTHHGLSTALTYPLQKSTGSYRARRWTAGRARRPPSEQAPTSRSASQQRTPPSRVESAVDAIYPFDRRRWLGSLSVAGGMTVMYRASHKFPEMILLSMGVLADIHHHQKEGVRGLWSFSLFSSISLIHSFPLHIVKVCGDGWLNFVTCYGPRWHA
jgi:hypothetical protein